MKLPLAFVLVAASIAAHAGLPSSDQDFVTTAGQGGLAEVALGKLASQQGASAAVKSFGKQMVADHSKGNAGLRRRRVKPARPCRAPPRKTSKRR